MDSQGSKVDMPNAMLLATPTELAGNDEVIYGRLLLGQRCQLPLNV